MNADDQHPKDQGWDDAAFTARVTELAGERNRTVRDVCEKAGLSKDILNHPANSKGRTVGLIMKLARELQVPVDALLGTQPAEQSCALAPDPNKLARLAVAAHVAAHLYVSLDSRRPAPSNAETERIIRMITELLEPPPRGN